MTTTAALRQPIEPIEDLAQRLEPRLKQLVARYRIPAQDAEDLVQTALIATLRNYAMLVDPEGWLIRTVINQCLMYHRSRRRRPEEPLGPEESLDLDTTKLVPVPSPEEQLVDREEVEIRLAKLPPVCRQLFRLRFLYGFNAKEVAELMGRKVSNIYATTHRCTKLLQEVRTLPPAGGGGRAKRWQETR